MHCVPSDTLVKKESQWSIIKRAMKCPAKEIKEMKKKDIVLLDSNSKHEAGIKNVKMIS